MDKELPQGLTMSEVEHRQKEEGRNELNVSQRRTFWAIASDVCREPMFMLLIGAGAIYLAMGDPHEAIILLGFVVIIMSVTILQERRTEKALEVLKDLSTPQLRSFAIARSLLFLAKMWFVMISSLSLKGSGYRQMVYSCRPMNWQLMNQC